MGVVWVCLKMLCTPLNPMVLLIIIPTSNGYNWWYTIFPDIPMCTEDSILVFVCFCWNRVLASESV